MDLQGGWTLKRFAEHLQENFVSSLTRLDAKDISRIAKEKIDFAEYLGLENSTDAVYAVVMKDIDEESYMATRVKIAAFMRGYSHSTYELMHWDPMPSYGDEDIHKVIAYAKKMKMVK